MSDSRRTFCSCPGSVLDARELRLHVAVAAHVSDVFAVNDPTSYAEFIRAIAAPESGYFWQMLKYIVPSLNPLTWRWKFLWVVLKWNHDGSQVRNPLTTTVCSLLLSPHRFSVRSLARWLHSISARCRMRWASRRSNTACDRANSTERALSSMKLATASRPRSCARSAGCCDACMCST